MRLERDVDTLPFEEMVNRNYRREPYGVASKSVCKVRRGNVCGSGSKVGEDETGDYLLTNAHVIGSRLGITGQFIFPELGNKSYNATIVAAGYSNRTMMDWAVCKTSERIPLPAIQLLREMPDGKHYTRGYPRCDGPWAQTLETVRFSNNGDTWLWLPASIGGQSGSAVHDYDTDLQVGLLTWLIDRRYGAGQTALGIWRQLTTRGQCELMPRFAGMENLCESAPAEDLVEGVHTLSEMANAADLPIWWEGGTNPPPPKPDPDQPKNPELAAELRKTVAELRKQAGNLEAVASTLEEPGNGGSGEGGGEGEGETDKPPVFVL